MSNVRDQQICKVVDICYFCGGGGDGGWGRDGGGGMGGGGGEGGGGGGDHPDGSQQVRQGHQEQPGRNKRHSLWRRQYGNKKKRKYFIL